MYEVIRSVKLKRYLKYKVLQKEQVTRSVKLNAYSKYDDYLLDTARDIRQITGPWNIGHSDLRIVWDYWHRQTEQVPKVWC